MNSIKNFFKRLDFKFYPIMVFPLLYILLTPFAMKFLPVEYTFENHLLENLQLLFLLITFVFCIKAKCDKTFFRCLALVCIILFLREINCGRTVFFPIEGVDNAFYSWKDIKYGWLVNPIYGLFMFGSGLYFLLSKSYLVLYKYFLYAQVSFYNWIFLFMGIIFGTLGEEISSFALEEMAESDFYLSFMSLIYLQGFNKKYIEATENKSVC